MKVVEIQLAREHVVSAYLQVPDHWDVNYIRRRANHDPELLNEIGKKIGSDWASDAPRYSIESISMKPVDETPDYVFKDETPAPVNHAPRGNSA